MAGDLVSGEEPPITPAEIERTYGVIRPYVRRTPVVEVDPADPPQGSAVR